MPKSPAQIESFLEATRHRLDSPEQTLGDEPNSYRKDWDSAETRTLIFACWPYAQAAGNQAIPMVYQTVNEHVGNAGEKLHLADRSYFFASGRDLRASEDKGIPIYGIESKHQMRDFDVVGTSISYPVLSVNLIKQLMMSDIPPTWDDRIDSTGAEHAGRYRKPEAYPMVICGGQSYGAPELVGNIVDAWFCGEVEDEPGNPGLGAVLDRVAAFKSSGRWFKDRLACYRLLAQEFRFLYFPAFVDIHYAYEDRVTVAEARRVFEQEGPTRPSKQVVGFTRLVDGMATPVVKRFVKDLDAIRGLDNPPLLYIDAGMGSGDAETSRGCPAWCSFCALTYRQKPYRQRSVEKMVDLTTKLLQNTGGIHIAPFGPDFPMHTQKNALIKALAEQVTDDVDASSMRVDDFIADPRYILLQAHAGMDTVTLGLEGNSQRMRDLIGKGAADEDVKQAVSRALQMGFKRIKLYMISQLPGEEDEDIYRILQLAKDIADIRDSMDSKAMIQFSWTPLLVEANTPMQWFAPTVANYSLGNIWEELRSLNIEFKLGGKSQKDRHFYFQLSQRASREIGKAMVEAICEKNAGTWGGVSPGTGDLIEQLLRTHGFLNGSFDANDERNKADMFGWEQVDQGINPELMWQTYQQMREFLEHTDAQSYDRNFSDQYHGSEWVPRCDAACQGKSCGVCDATDLKIRRGYIQAAAREADVDLNKVKVVDQRTVSMRVRVRFETSQAKRMVGTAHWRYAIRRAAYRVGLPITKRDIGFGSGQPQYKDWTNGIDYVEFGLLRRVHPDKVGEAIQAMNVELGEDIQLSDYVTRPIKADLLRADVDLSLYELESDVDLAKASACIRDWFNTEYVPVKIHTETYGQGLDVEEVNGRDYVDEIRLVQQDHQLKMRMTLRGKVNPYVISAALFRKSSWISAAQYPAKRLESFLRRRDDTVDFFTKDCVECGRQIPNDLLDRPYDPHHCPQCKDRVEGRLVSL